MGHSRCVLDPTQERHVSVYYYNNNSLRNYFLQSLSESIRFFVDSGHNHPCIRTRREAKLSPDVFYRGLLLEIVFDFIVPSLSIGDA